MKQSNLLVNKRLSFTVEGIVQGVGFRPFIYRLATDLKLTGFVYNTRNGVYIEIQGDEKALNHFQNKLQTNHPSHSIITKINSKHLPIKNENEFIIQESYDKDNFNTLILPDIRVCDQCINELFDPNNRRYLYPFIHCTQCGPRYTILNQIPFDRCHTSMEKFSMCHQCLEEYNNPKDRRFHYQSNACPECGPALTYVNNTISINTSQDAIERAVQDLINGKIVVIKGLGGFHLVVDPFNNNSVNMLRQRKGRYLKPFALMVLDIPSARQFVDLLPNEITLLQSSECPIVLINKQDMVTISPLVAPDLNQLGIMLPYTPLHYLLLKRYKDLSSKIPALIMTSANYSDEPLIIDNNSAKTNLKDIADSYLYHNRDIIARVDDSVAIAIDNKSRIIRRSRGYTPLPIPVSISGKDILAVGGELKNTICYLKDQNAFISQHIGDTRCIECYESFQQIIQHMKNLLNIDPKLIVHDLHPQYMSTQWSNKQTDIALLPVQHHHAHMASCMTEWNIDKQVIGIILDGTGYGPDGTIWGGEVLIGDYSGYYRFAHLQNIVLPGGDKCIAQPWRTTVSYLYQTYGQEIPDIPILFNKPIQQVITMIYNNINCIQTSSAGRLFDAIASITGIGDKNHYEAQLSIQLMQHALVSDLWDKVDTYNFILESIEQKWVIQTTPLIRDIVQDVQNNLPINIISTRFHKTMVESYKQLAVKAKSFSGINNVVLSGGVFQNVLMLQYLTKSLQEEGFTVYSHEKVPCNDGGISLGQAMIGRYHLNHRTDL